MILEPDLNRDKRIISLYLLRDKVVRKRIKIQKCNDRKNILEDTIYEEYPGELEFLVLG